MTRRILIQFCMHVAYMEYLKFNTKIFHPCVCFKGVRGQTPLTPYKYELIPEIQKPTNEQSAHSHYINFTKTSKSFHIQIFL